jgi:hypothetical protein
MNLKTSLLIFPIIITLLFAGCQQKGLSDYSTPEATYKTYVMQAKALRVVADHRNYRRAIRCFTDNDRKWFEKNYDKIKIDKEEELYKSLYKTKKQAYVFGRSVVLLGPSPDEEHYTFKEISPEEVELQVKGYPKKIKLIKTRRDWQIVGLFNVREKVSQ